MDDLGHLSRENQQTLQALGAQVEKELSGAVETEAGVVTNYHVSRVLRLRQKLKGQLAGRRH